MSPFSQDRTAPKLIARRTVDNYVIISPVSAFAALSLSQHSMAAAADDKRYVCKSESEAVQAVAAFAKRNSCSAVDVEFTIRNPPQPQNVPDETWDSPAGNVCKRHALYRMLT